jgi:signal transduction histidine kinase
MNAPAPAPAASELQRLQHELRTPLSGVLGLLELVRREPGLALLPRAQVWLDSIGIASMHMLRLVERLGAVEGRADTRTQGDLQRAADATVRLLEFAALEAGVVVQLQAPQTGPMLVGTSETVLRQVLVNLVSNGIKYSRYGGAVSVTLAADANDPQAWMVHVRDTGIGMDEGQLARLFQPYERLGRQDDGIGGTGLGLHLTQTLVHDMGGTIHVASRPAAGTCVSLRLPRAAAPVCDEPAACSPGVP